jgi:NTP pyrophosphatase (non-canonical NTP hydrolase)
MSVINFQANSFQSNSVALDYDLQAEKKRIAEGTEEIKKELLEKWKKQYKDAKIFPETLSKLNPEARDVLLAFKNTLLYNDITEKLALNSKQRSALPKIVWGICLNKAWSQLNIALIEHLNIHSTIAEKIAIILTENIINKVQDLSVVTPERENVFQKAESVEKNSENSRLSLAPEEAYRQFPEIGEQLISVEPIKLKSSVTPVRPSVSNWLADYTFKFGFNAHTSVERGTYLFQDENAKNLSFQEKQRVSYILKTYDEKSPLTIDTAFKTIIFPDTQAKQERMAPQSIAPEKKEQVSFSYPQKLPYEKMQAPVQPLMQNFPPKKEISASPVNKNVVNLKELG